MNELFYQSQFLSCKERFENDNCLQLSFTSIKKSEVERISEICTTEKLTYIITIPYNGLITFTITKLN